MNTSVKRNLVCLLSFIAFTTAIQAQKTSIRLNAYGGYVFDDKVDSYYSNTSYFNGREVYRVRCYGKKNLRVMGMKMW